MNYCSYMDTGANYAGYSLEKESLPSTDWSDHWSPYQDQHKEPKLFTRAEIVQTVGKFEHDFTTPSPGAGFPMPRTGPYRAQAMDESGQPFKALLALPVPA